MAHLNDAVTLWLVLLVVVLLFVADELVYLALLFDRFLSSHIIEVLVRVTIVFLCLNVVGGLAAYMGATTPAVIRWVAWAFGNAVWITLVTMISDRARLARIAPPGLGLTICLVTLLVTM